MFPLERWLFPFHGLLVLFFSIKSLQNFENTFQTIAWFRMTLFRAVVNTRASGKIGSLASTGKYRNVEKLKA